MTASNVLLLSLLVLGLANAQLGTTRDVANFLKKSAHNCLDGCIKASPSYKRQKFGGGRFWEAVGTCIRTVLTTIESQVIYPAVNCIEKKGHNDCHSFYDVVLGDPYWTMLETSGAPDLRMDAKRAAELKAVYECFYGSPCLESAIFGAEKLFQCPESDQYENDADDCYTAQMDKYWDLNMEEIMHDKMWACIDDAAAKELKMEKPKAH